MSINLKDIPDAVKAYLDSKVTVNISGVTPTSGSAINPNEAFTFKIDVANANAANSGVALKNVRYRVSVDNPAVVKLKVPPAASGTTTDLAGGPLTAGTEVGAMIFRPASSAFNLPVGDSDTLSLTGKASNAVAGGNTIIRARVLADIDLDLLFPKGEDTASTEKTIQVVG